MKANEFVKKYGWEVTKECLLFSEKYTDAELVAKYEDLKRIVESYDLVESCGGLQSVKDTFNFAWSHGADELTEYGERLKQAIEDVERCK